MKIGELLLEAASLDSAAKKHGLVKVALPPYHDQPQIKHWALRTPKGKTIIEFEIDPREEARGKFIVYHKSKSNNFKTQAEAVAFIEGLKLEIVEKTLDDEAIAKWLGKQMAVRLKLSNVKNLGFIEWGPKATQLVERGGYEPLPYMIFVDGDRGGDDKAGLGEIGMNTKDLRAWLVKQGATKRDKPKRARNTYYD